MQIFMIRHGSTAGNLEHRYVGATDEELTETAVDELKLNRARYPVPELVIVSPMKRCIQTADLLFPGIPQIRIEGLKECSFGEFEYKNYQELSGVVEYQAWIDSGGTLPFPGGESREEFGRRCCHAFLEGTDLAESQGIDKVAFVVHGGTIMAVLDRFSSPNREYFSWQLSNGRGFQGQFLSGCITEITQVPLQADPIGIEQQYVMKQNKKLRCGYTTGSCAAAAAKAAARMLLTGEHCYYADLMTPRGIPLHLPVQDQQIGENGASCAVRKYGGDDPDATDGLLIYAAAEFFCPTETKEYTDPINKKGETDRIDSSSEQKACVRIEGGTGVGRVTRPGLEQPVGEAAINHVPREMITKAVQEVCTENDYFGRIKITVSVPKGEKIARKTFNPHIGIMGGISILGTSGIVVPMSEEALIASIRVEMKQRFAGGEEYLLITPGNYGEAFIRKKERSEVLDGDHSMKCSNYIGETLDIAAELGVKGILFVAHIGKFIKVSGGIMNTHSAQGDCRAELMAAQAMRAGADSETVNQILCTNTTEEAVGILKEKGILEQTITETAGRIRFYLQKRCQGKLETEVILYSNQYGYLGETKGADHLIRMVSRTI